ncbi:MAG: hypothetical protein M1820_008384 [Bogoriella megaspora]|nr:MAG: hypothetical protein M1820_008384 [Bogoriella megaspora]
MPDIESSTKRREYIRGFPSLADFVASDGDRTTMIYKRFDRLAARTLLHLQSELAELQARQDAYDEEDRRAGDMDCKQTLRNWVAFKKRVETDPSRFELAEEIQTKMEKYRKTLLLEAQLASIPRPHKRTLDAFRTNFFNGKPGSDDSWPTLGGSSRYLYDNIDDLVALKIPEHQDRVFLLVQDYLGFLFGEGKEAHVEGRVGYVSGQAITTFIAWLSTFLAAVLLIGAIVVLYFVQEPNWRLGLIAVFTSLFAISVGIFTNARRTELFGATAA